MKRPTAIYWLFDTRPEKMAVWPKGEPFYCGKTVLPLEQRLYGHVYDAQRAKTPRATATRILVVGEHLRIIAMQVFPPDVDWVEREKHWIRMLRHLNPNATNITEGGQGAPGNKQSPEAREKIRRALKGLKRSEEQRKRIASGAKKWWAVYLSKCQSPETAVGLGYRAMRLSLAYQRSIAVEKRARRKAQKAEKHLSANI